jgi:hypothetical protein
MTYLESKELLEKYLRHHHIEYRIREHIVPETYYGGHIHVVAEINNRRMAIEKQVQYSRNMAEEHGPASYAMEEIRQRIITTHIFMIHGYEVEHLSTTTWPDVPDYVRRHVSLATQRVYVDGLRFGDETYRLNNWRSEMMHNWNMHSYIVDPRRSVREGINT